MQNVPLEIVSEFAGHLEEQSPENGERWNVLSSASRTDILHFRSVCRGFRDGSWSGFGRILGETPFSLSPNGLTALEGMSRHEEVRHWIKVITFGAQKYTYQGLQLLQESVQNYPSAHLSVGQPWKLSLSSFLSSNLREVLENCFEYQRQLKEQEDLWDSGEAAMLVHRALHHFREPLHIRLCPTASKNKPLWRISTTRFVDLLWLSPQKYEYEDLRISCLDHFTLSASTPLLRAPGLRNLKTLKITLTEERLVRDGKYSDNVNHQGLCLVNSLASTPKLTSLDIGIRYSNTTNFRSIILAELSRVIPCYKLQHLCLDNAIMSEEDFAQLFRYHAKALDRLVLITPWLRPGTWDSLLKSMATQDLIRLDYLEIYKPSQGAVAYYENHDWIKLWPLCMMAKRSKLVQFHGNVDENTGEILTGSWCESWENHLSRTEAR